MDSDGYGMNKPRNSGMDTLIRKDVTTFDMSGAVWCANTIFIEQLKSLETGLGRMRLNDIFSILEV